MPFLAETGPAKLHSQPSSPFFDSLVSKESRLAHSIPSENGTDTESESGDNGSSPKVSSESFKFDEQNANKKARNQSTAFIMTCPQDPSDEEDASEEIFSPTLTSSSAEIDV